MVEPHNERRVGRVTLAVADDVSLCLLPSTDRRYLYGFEFKFCTVPKMSHWRTLLRGFRYARLQWRRTFKWNRPIFEFFANVHAKFVVCQRRPRHRRAQIKFVGSFKRFCWFLGCLASEGLGLNDTATVTFKLDVEGTYARAAGQGIGQANFSFYAVSGLEDINTNTFDLVSGAAIYRTEWGSDVVNSTAAPEVFSSANNIGDWQQLSTNQFLATIDVSGSDPTLLFVMDLGAGSPADFLHAGRISLSPLPTGVTFTSDSGVFLSQRTPTTSIPEPASLALLGLGLASLGFVRRRKRA